jgi:hypothetical protein
MERLISVAAIDQEFKFAGQCLFVDTDGTLHWWGPGHRQTDTLREALRPREEEMKRFLIARALRDNGG